MEEEVDYGKSDTLYILAFHTVHIICENCPYLGWLTEQKDVQIVILGSKVSEHHTHGIFVAHSMEEALSIDSATNAT